MGTPTQGAGAPTQGRASLHAIWLAAAITLVTLGVMCACSLWINGGRLVFSLDDPYIHFALAHHLAQGHYGINPGEYAAPSSSILWPWLLLPLTHSDNLLTWTVLVFNSLCALGTLFCFWLAWPEAAAGDTRRRATTAVVLLLCLLASNHLTLVFTGLEHALQVLTCAAMTLGLTRFAKTGSTPWWWLASIVLAPLLRYECAALSVLNLAFLAYRGHMLMAMGTLLVMVAPMAAFSEFLLSHDLGALPTSIIAKGNIAEHSTRAMIWLHNLKQNSLSIKGGLLAGLTLCLFAHATVQRANPTKAGPAWVLAASALAHLVLGRAGYRYDAYLWSASIVMLLSHHGAAMATWPQLNPITWHPRPLPLLHGAVGAGILAKSLAYTAITPLATSNIHEQQYQMRRFAQELYQGPVAVNDLGLVAYKSKQYVLDLGGLASLEATRRHQQREHMWRGPMTQAHGVHLVMVYEKQFQPIPTNWLKLGDLILGHAKLSAAEPTVAFFATDCATAIKTQTKLDEFAAGLPPGARFERKPLAAGTCRTDQFAQAK